MHNKKIRTFQEIKTTLNKLLAMPLSGQKEYPKNHLEGNEFPRKKNKKN